MSISVECACGKSEQVPDDFAGRRVRCKACGARIDIGFAVAESHAAGGDQGTLSYSGLRRNHLVISRERMLASRSCFCWAGILLFLSTCVGASLLSAMGSLGARIRPQMISGGLTLGILLAFAVIYGVGGMCIRRGGSISVVVCLVVASIQTFFSGMSSAIYLMFSLTGNPLAIIAAAIAVLISAAFVQLDYYLIMILRQRAGT